MSTLRARSTCIDRVRNPFLKRVCFSNYQSPNLLFEKADVQPPVIHARTEKVNVDCQRVVQELVLSGRYVQAVNQIFPSRWLSIREDEHPCASLGGRIVLLIYPSLTNAPFRLIADMFAQFRIFQDIGDL